MLLKRNTALDILRSIAAIAVVLYHVLGSSVNNDPLVLPHLRTIVTSFCATMQWHVPVFFMITGYLWLSEEKECTYQKMVPNIRRFLCVLFTIGFAYAVMERFFSVRILSASLFLGSLKDVLTGNLWDHMWYLYSAIGIYLILPVLKPFFENASIRAVSLFVGILFVFSIAAPIVDQLSGYRNPIDIPVSSSLFYVSLGGLLHKKKCAATGTAFVSGISFLCSSVIIFIISRYVAVLDCLLTLFVCISAVSLFVALLRIFAFAEDTRILRAFSDCTFGIYLFHPLLINLVIKLLHFYPARSLPVLTLALFSVCISLISFAMTYVLRRIPWIRKYIL